MIKYSLSILLALSLVVMFSCSSDPEGPVTERFMDEGSYTVKAGDTYRIKVPVSVRTFPVPVATGERPVLGLGRLKGVCYKAVLMKFDFTSGPGFQNRTIDKAILKLPVRVVPPDSSFTVDFTINELLESFNESDTLTNIPDYSTEPVPDSLGVVDRRLGIVSTEFSLDKTNVAEWLSAGGERSIALIMQSQSDSSGVVEMNAHEMGSDPPAITVSFTDSTDTVYAAVEDYNIIQIQDSSLSYVGGVAQRLLFTFSLDAVNDSAMVHASFLVVSIDGAGSFGATPADEAIIGRSSTFLYYLYTPDSGDINSTGILSGTGVDRGSFIALDSTTVRFNLRGFIPDLISGFRENTGLVLQSDEELFRVQKAVLGSGDGFEPYIEIIYSLPARF